MDLEVQGIHNQTSIDPAKGGKRPPRDTTLYATYAKLRSENELVYVEGMKAIYRKSRNLYEPQRERQLIDMITNASAAFGLNLLKRDYDDVLSLMRIHSESIEEPNRGCIMISENLYWDKEKGEVSRQPIGRVFYRLFDTTTETKHVVTVSPFTPEQEERLLERYEQVKAELQRGEERERYEFLKTWAAGSHDVYMDLHRAHAYMFLKKKPLGAYMLIGLKRNGKSSYIGLTHTIMGANNTSNVQLTQLGDPHITHMLRTTLMNAPDEEDDKAVSAQGFFKIMADHGTLSLPVMRSNVPVQLNCDFMCFFPMNHTPEWTGSGAAACMDRSLIIPFNADLSKFDQTSGNFAKDTFTADMMADYMGSVFAYAWWYHRHDLEFSDTMRTEQCVLEQDLDSCLTYFKHFSRYFDGFESFKVVYSDYQFWCQAQDVKINTRKELKFVFRNIVNNKTSYRKQGEPKKIYRLPQSGKQPLMNDFIALEDGVEALETLHEKHSSIVDRLDSHYEALGV